MVECIGALIIASLELGTQDSSIGIPLWNALAGKGRHRITNTSRELEQGTHSAFEQRPPLVELQFRDAQRRSSTR